MARTMASPRPAPWRGRSGARGERAKAVAWRVAGAGGVGGAGEAVKGRRLEAVGEAGAVVGDREVDVIGVLTQAGSDGAFSVEKGVVEEVAQRLLDAGRVGFGDERFGVDGYRAPAGTVAACRTCCDGADEFVEVDRLDGERQRSFFDLGEREEVVGEAADAARFV